MKETIEYLIAFTAILLVFSYFAVESYLSTTSVVDVVDQDVFARRVEAYMNVLVNTPGHPQDWGYTELVKDRQGRIIDINWIRPYKLGLNDPNISQPYALSPEKLTSLAEGVFTEEEIMNAMGTNLRFRLVLRPLLSANITWEQTQSGITYYITVFTHNSMPSSNTNVTAILVYTIERHGHGGNTELRNYTASGVTDGEGFIAISFSIPNGEMESLEENGVLTVYMRYGLLTGLSLIHI